MLKNQFFGLLTLLIATGVIYVKAFMNMAVRDNKEVKPQEHNFIKVLGVIFALVAIIFGVLGIWGIGQVNYPDEMLPPIITKDSIIRHPAQTLFWGYPTYAQNSCIASITMTFGFLGIAFYCILFRSSDSTVGGKIGKFLFCLIFYSAYSQFSDLHYFDIWELIGPIIFCVMTYFAMRSPKGKVEVEPIQKTEDGVAPTSPSSADSDNSEIEPNREDASRFMPPTMGRGGVEPMQKSNEDAVAPVNSSNTDTDDREIEPLAANKEDDSRFMPPIIGVVEVEENREHTPSDETTKASNEALLDDMPENPHTSDFVENVSRMIGNLSEEEKRIALELLNNR